VDEYFAEVYDDNDEDREHTPLSLFARDQDEKWYDHDFLEYGFGEGARSIEELAAGYSYHEQWSGVLAHRAAQAGLNGMNMFVFINEEEIDQPKSTRGDDYWLEYLGTITYQI
jgi:hypothetical protein